MCYTQFKEQVSASIFASQHQISVYIAAGVIINIWIVYMSMLIITKYKLIMLIYHQLNFIFCHKCIMFFNMPYIIVDVFSSQMKSVNI